MRARILTTTAVLAVFAGLTAGCSSPAEKTSSVPQTSARSGPVTTTAPSTTTTIPPIPPTTALVGTAQQLRERLAMHEICVTEIPSTEYQIVPITSAVACDDGYEIFVFPSVSARDEAIELISGSLCFVPFFLAVSEDWIVYPVPPTAFRAGRIIDLLGGEVREVPCTYDPPEDPPE